MVNNAHVEHISGQFAAACVQMGEAMMERWIVFTSIILRDDDVLRHLLFALIRRRVK